ncbi:hypothetical protein PUR23_19955 [Methylorubrum populi]|uniref:hypothetical protein n=1 Tax=Methylorubrum populi TaxID=223967 RepID=UPI0031F7F407
MTGPVTTEALVERLRRISAKWAIFSDERGLVSGLATEAADALQQVTAERDAAIKTCEMAAMSGGFYARHAESAETRANRAKVAHDTATSELARLRAEGEAAAYLIDRLQACHEGRPVRDLPEATGAYLAARAATAREGA